MAIGLIGRKLGMTRTFNVSGVSVPVTVIYVETNRVSQVKSLSKDGYEALQFAAGVCKPRKLNKPLNGHLSKALLGPAKVLREFRVSSNEFSPQASEFNVDHFNVGECVDVVATSKGK